MCSEQADAICEVLGCIPIFHTRATSAHLPQPATRTQQRALIATFHMTNFFVQPTFAPPSVEQERGKREIGRTFLVAQQRRCSAKPHKQTKWCKNDGAEGKRKNFCSLFNVDIGGQPAKLT